MKTMETYKDRPVHFFDSAAAWSAWLAQHYDQTEGLWLKFAKKASGIKSLTYDEALDEALCYGWIDGQAQSLDETYYLQRFTPRRSKSIWSKRNVGKIATLTAAGRMKPTGIAQVEAAQADGRWEQAYEGPKNIQVPAEFQALLSAHPKAQATFETLSKTSRYYILWQIQTAKRAETRQRRMQKFIEQLTDGVTKY